MGKIFLSFILGATFVVYSAPIIYEAENQIEAKIVVDSTGFSGGKFVKTSQGISFDVNVDSTDMYDLSVAVWVKQYDWFNSAINVNGTDIGSFLTNAPNGDSSYVLQASAKLKKGENTIKVMGGALNVDYLSVEAHPKATFKINATPVTPGATASAQKLMTFLRDNFTKKTISGMMIGDNVFNYHYGKSLEDSYLIEKCAPEDSCENSDERTTWKGQEDISEFKKRSGDYPALGGFDMLFSTGANSNNGWFSGYTDNNIRMAKELWNLGGIPAFTWHWKVGEDSVFYAKNKGFNDPLCDGKVLDSSPDNTCFNYTKAFKDVSCKEVDETSNEYKLLMADVDKISARFLDLQEAGVAIIWRPLHEAAGGWFWWGVASSECYVNLYKLVFDRMVNVNKVKNALWVWNIERDPSIGYDYSALNAKWYPGDSLVDIIGVDIYNNSNDNQSNASAFNKIVAEMGTNKIIALTENGPIPDVDSTFEDNAVWSFWMPWYNTWNSGFLNQTSDEIWQKNIRDNRIISLKDMPGWEHIKADDTYIKQKSTLPKAQILLQGNLLIVNVNKNAQVEIFDLLGHKIYKQKISYTGAISLDSFAKGNYIVQVKGSSVAKIIEVK